MSTFTELWDLHWRWRHGIFLRDIISGRTVDVYRGVPHDYYSRFAVPRVREPSALDFREIATDLPRDVFAAIHLLERHKSHGYYEYLARRHYRYHSTGSWLLYDGPFTPSTTPPHPQIVSLTRETFADYELLCAALDAEDTAHPYASVPYYTAERRLIDGSHPAIRMELFGMYDERTLVSAGGLIYSHPDNFAWIPTAGTRKPYRDAGEYQYRCPLLRYRLKRALDLGITRIYALSEFGSFLWSDLLAAGFKQVQEVRIFLNFSGE